MSIITLPDLESPACVADDAAIVARDLGTDLDASVRFAEAYADRVRYVAGIGWLVWDGKRWAKDSDGRVVELAKKSAVAWTKRATMAYDQDREKRVRNALALENGSRIRAAVDLARSDPRVVTTANQLDRENWILNVENGTLDLRNGNLLPHDRANLITKLAPVSFSHDARHPMLDRYLATIAAHSPETVGFLARCIGATLTGDASAESLFLIQGNGGTGKTTLLEACAAMLGDYAVKLAFESFCQSKHGRSPGGASPDLLRLRGSRLAYASEGDQSARLDSGVVKLLTGNEPITARGLYASPMTFPQTWKLFLVTNFDPRTDSEDTGMWRRMIKIHFHDIPEADRDPAIKAAILKDHDAQAALLAWALKGCLDWQQRGGSRIGLATPAEVNAATEKYRQREDSMAQWWDYLNLDAVLSKKGFTIGSSLRKHYDNWCDANGSSRVQMRRFSAYLESRGLTEKRKNCARGWEGITLSP